MLDGREDKRRCPACAEWIMLEARKCRYCGVDVAAAEAERDSAVERTLFAGSPQPIYSAEQYVVAFVTLGIGYLVYWLRSRGVRYTITTQRVRVERGLLGKMLETLEVFRIEHFELQRPLGMRLLGNAALHLVTSDQQFPSLLIVGVPGIDAIAETLRECNLRERGRRKVTTFVQA